MSVSGIWVGGDCRKMKTTTPGPFYGVALRVQAIKGMPSASELRLYC